MPVKNTTIKKRTAKKAVKAEQKPTEQALPKLRIKLRAYDHKIIDNSARQIIDIKVYC